ncbi:MAG: DUF2975 domain-containing protein [Henriciella sp.]|nr:DUF2975 domain-containing protein [Henriciella sp.]
MTDTEIEKTRNTHRDLTYLAWIVVGVLALNVAFYVGGEIGEISVSSRDDLWALNEGLWIGIIKAMPTILIAWAIADFAFLFQRCSEGEVFSEENVKTLDQAAYGLIVAGIWAAAISPTLLQWISENFRGIIVDFGDLSIAVTMMGIMLHGLSLVFKDAVAVKTENDEFV